MSPDRATSDDTIGQFSQQYGLGTMTDLEAWQVVCKPIPLATYKSARRRAMTARIFVILAALAVISGALIALQPIYEAVE